MRLSNKPNIATGSVLLLVAAFFSIALALLPMDFGPAGPGINNPLYIAAYKLGDILFTVYGFSSILIPIFLFAAGISCFATKWTARKSMRLLTAIIPFFTSVFVEKICIAMLDDPDDFTSIKIVLTAGVGLFLMAIEIVAAGIFADRVNDFLFHRDGTSSKSDETDDDEEYSDEEETEEKSTENDIESEEPALSETVPEENEAANDFVPPAPENDPFADVFDTPAEETANEEIQEVSDSTEQETESEEASENESVQPLLSREEYAALNKINEDLLEENQEPETQQPEKEETVQDFNFPDDSPTDELEWPSTDEIISQAGITENEEKSLLGDDYENEDESSAESDDTIEENLDDHEEPESDPYSEFGFDETVSEDDAENDDEEYTKEINPYEDSEYIDNQVQKKNDELDPDFFDIDMNSDEDEEINEYPEEEELDSKKAEHLENIRQMNFLEQSLISDTANEDADAIEKSRSFFEDIVESQEDDDELNDDENDENLEQEENPEEEPVQQKKSEYSDSDEDDFGQTNSTFDIASDIFADMAQDAREQITSGKKPNRFAQPDYETEQNPEPQETDSDSSYETAEPPARTTVRTEPKQEGHRVQPKKPYIVPTDLMEQYEDDQYWIIDEETKGAALKLEETLDQFGISAKVTGIKKGPVVTMFEIVPAPGVRLSKIVSLQDNIALSLAASSVRIVAPIPGKAAVGIEIPNKKRSIVSFREIIEQDIPEYTKMAIPVILGKDILGKSQIIDIAKTPHLLIAGATGAGKSVCVNSLILSILYKRSPRQVKMILVDPKVVELKLYNDIPHLLTPVITEPKKALQALQYCLCEMERRYALLDGLGVRDISNYNKRVEERNICTEKLPYIVVIIDEFADLMATSGRDLESIVARLTAMSRAVGIHLVLATQRPSVNVITGLIKANIPSRIAFMVSSRTDSNIIIDSVGAEKLLGKGDMLYASAVDPNPIRIQGTFESDNDVESVVNYVKTLGEPEYIDDEIFVDDDEEEGGGGTGLFNDGVSDPLYEQALDIVIQSGKASASYLQRRLSIGYNRAARLVEEMEERGIVGPANGSKPREIIHVPG